MVKRIAALLALIPATFAAAPAHGADPITSFNTPNTASTMFFVSIPLDGKTRKQRETGYGLALQGQQRTFVVDTRVLKNNFGLEAIAGLEIKWLLAGAAAVATPAAVGSSSAPRAEAQTTAQATQSAAIAASSGTTTGSAPAPSGTSSTGGTTTTTTSSTSTTSSTGGTSGVTSPGVAPCTVTPSC